MKVVKGYYKNDEWYQYVKAYNDIGLNDDGGVTQKALTNFMCDLSLGLRHVIVFVKNGNVMNNVLYVVDDNEEFELEDVSTIVGGTISSIVITMGGNDITSTAYDDGDISIASVTGNVIVNATV